MLYKRYLFFFFCISKIWAAQEGPVQVLQDMPIEERIENKIIVSCPEVIRPKIKLNSGWESHPCGAKFKSLSPSTYGGQKDVVQCYFSYICGGGDFTISKHFAGHTCLGSAAPDERKITCIKDNS